jgi:hypothetical protein
MGEMVGKLKELGNSFLGPFHNESPSFDVTKAHRKLWSLDRQFQIRAERTRGILRQFFEVMVALRYFSGVEWGQLVEYLVLTREWRWPVMDSICRTDPVSPSLNR